MTAAKVEQIARFMHEAWRERYEAQRRGRKFATAPPLWERLPGWRKDDYRHAARAVLKRLGH